MISIFYNYQIRDKGSLKFRADDVERLPLSQDLIDICQELYKKKCESLRKDAEEQARQNPQKEYEKETYEQVNKMFQETLLEFEES